MTIVPGASPAASRDSRPAQLGERAEPACACRRRGAQSTAAGVDGAPARAASTRAIAPREASPSARPPSPRPAASAAEHRPPGLLGVARHDHEGGGEPAMGDRDADSAGAAMALDSPGTTSNGTPAAARASASSPPRPKTNGSPPLRRTTRLPRRAARTSSAWIVSCRVERPAGALAHGEALRARRELQRLAADERVVEDEVRLGERARGAQRQQLGVARARADQRDVAAHPAASVQTTSEPAVLRPVAAYRRRRALSSSGRRRAIGTPAARCSRRSRAAARPSDPRRRGSPPRAPRAAGRRAPGARPSVETATVTPPRRSTPPV